MKVSSVGLETEVHLSPEEIKKLRVSALTGHTNFRECDERTTRRIPFKLIYDFYQKEFSEVKIMPEGTYFGEAKEITCMINDYLYSLLITTGSCMDRFWNSGKLSLIAENIK